MSMKKLFFLFAFLVGLGISSSVYAQLVKEVTLTSANTLASELGTDVGKVTTLKVNGPLGAEDFQTMKKQMAMLQVLDMSGVTELPKTKYWNGKEHVELQSIQEEAFQNKLTLQMVIFPEVLQQINDKAFKGCNNLTEVDFSQATQLIMIWNNAFQGAVGIQPFFVLILMVFLILDIFLVYQMLLFTPRPVTIKLPLYRLFTIIFIEVIILEYRPHRLSAEYLSQFAGMIFLNKLWFTPS